MSSNIRTILMPLAILLGILFPQFHGLSNFLPFFIGIMMFLTFISSVPPQEHHFTFKIEMRSLATGMILVSLLVAGTYLFNFPKEILLAGILLALSPPANAAPAMAKILGGNPVLMFKIFIIGHVIACFSIPLVFGFFTGNTSFEVYLEMAKAIFNKMQSIVTIPLALALGIRTFNPRVADKFLRFQKYTIFVWSFSVFVILSHASFKIRHMENMNWNLFFAMAILSLAFCVLLFIFGWFSGKPKYPIESSQSLGQKNTVLIIILAQTFAKEWPLVVLGPIWYVIWQNLALSYMNAKVKRTPVKEK